MIHNESLTALHTAESKVPRSKKIVRNLARLVMGKADAKPSLSQGEYTIPASPETVGTKAYTTETETKPVELDILHALQNDVNALDTKIHRGVSLKDAWYRARHESADRFDISLNEQNQIDIDGTAISGERYRNAYGLQNNIAVYRGADLVVITQGFEQDRMDDYFVATQYKIPSEYSVDLSKFDLVHMNVTRAELEQYAVARAEAHYIAEYTADTSDQGDALSTLDSLMTIQATLDNLIK